MILPFASCSSDVDDNLSVTLPNSIGENPFTGKTFKGKIKLSGDISSNTDFYYNDENWTFTENTLEATEIDEDSISKTIYRYTYNANDNLLYLAINRHEISYTDESGETFSIECTNAKQMAEKETRLAELSETQFKILE